MKNFKLVVSYDGTRYFGWEHQPDTEMTIQGKLESVLNEMLSLPEGCADASSTEQSIRYVRTIFFMPVDWCRTMLRRGRP